jgi:hypothetical protein
LKIRTRHGFWYRSFHWWNWLGWRLRLGRFRAVFIPYAWMWHWLLRRNNDEFLRQSNV